LSVGPGEKENEFFPALRHRQESRARYSSHLKKKRAFHPTTGKGEESSREEAANFNLGREEVVMFSGPE